MDLETYEPLPTTESTFPLGFVIGAAFISCVVWLSLILGRMVPFVN